MQETDSNSLKCIPCSIDFGLVGFQSTTKATVHLVVCYNAWYHINQLYIPKLQISYTYPSSKCHTVVCVQQQLPQFGQCTSQGHNGMGSHFAQPIAAISFICIALPFECKKQPGFLKDWFEIFAWFCPSLSRSKNSNSASKIIAWDDKWTNMKH